MVYLIEPTSPLYSGLDLFFSPPHILVTTTTPSCNDSDPPSPLPGQSH